MKGRINRFDSFIRLGGGNIFPKLMQNFGRYFNGNCSSLAWGFFVCAVCVCVFSQAKMLTDVILWITPEWWVVRINLRLFQRNDHHKTNTCMWWTWNSHLRFWHPSINFNFSIFKIRSKKKISRSFLLLQ